MDKMNILIVGVGGQGTLLASVLLGNLALDKGYDVKLSEVHGMAQRGGSVVTHVKIDREHVNSPLIEPGDADMIIAFEELEAYRWLPYLKKGGVMYVNTQQIMPMPVVLGQAEYPQDIIARLKEKAGPRRGLRRAGDRRKAAAASRPSTSYCWAQPQETCLLTPTSGSR